VDRLAEATTGQRIGELRHEQHVRRPREKESSGLTVPVHGDLERREQARHPLDLIEDRAPGQVRHEARRVGLRGGAHHVVVQVEVGVAPLAAKPLRQGRFAALARPVDEDDWAVAQRLLQAGFDEPRRDLAALANGNPWGRLIERLLVGHMKPSGSARRNLPTAMRRAIGS